MTSTEAGTTWGVRHRTITAVRPVDTRLAALLESKPPIDGVPLEVWWHIAESLRRSIPVRRAREGVAVIDDGVLRRETDQATWSAQAALAHLGEGPSRRAIGRADRPNVRVTIRDLARLVVSARATPLETLRGAVLNHLDALGSPELR